MLASRLVRQSLGVVRVSSRFGSSRFGTFLTKVVIFDLFDFQKKITRLNPMTNVLLIFQAEKIPRKHIGKSRF